MMEIENDCIVSMLFDGITELKPANVTQEEKADNADRAAVVTNEEASSTEVLETVEEAHEVVDEPQVLILINGYFV